MRLYMGLVHFPVYNKHRECVASAITTLDIHDLARLARTYDAKRLFIITPLDDQRALASRVVRHWTEGYGSRYNQDRKEALERVSVGESLAWAFNRIQEMEGEPPIAIATDASDQGDRSLSYQQARQMIKQDRAVALIFGTAWGLHEEAIKPTDHVLAPIRGKTGYNHLSVRTAAAIILDRLVG